MKIVFKERAHEKILKAILEAECALKAIDHIELSSDEWEDFSKYVGHSLVSMMDIRTMTFECRFMGVRIVSPR